jgi:two-component system response regulator YesN
MMKSVIVVDDELIVREFFEKAFPWDSIGMQLIDTAADGQSALEKCKALQPVLVLIDIVMPGMGGLELLEYLRMEVPYTQCVILTSHEDFKYIQSALKLGALDYIVKSDTTPDEMVLKFKEINRRIDLIHAKPGLSTIQNEWLVRLLSRGISGKQELVNDLNRFHFSISDGSIQVLLLEPDEPFQPMEFETSPEEVNITPTIREALEEEVGNSNSIVWTHIPPNQFALVESSNNTNIDEENNKLARIFHIIRSDIEDRFSLYGGLSTRHCSLLDAPLAYKEAKEALISKFYFDSHLIPYRASWNQLSKETYEYLDQLAIDKKPQQQSKESFINELLDNILDLCERHWIEPQNAKLLVIGFINQMSRNMHIDFSNWDMSLWPVQTASITHADELIGWAYSIIERLLASAEYPTLRPEIKRIIDEIQMNLSAELDLNWASNLVSFHPNYLSSIFRKETGETFSNYLCRVRIERATKYLQEGVWSNQQVAEMVGLSDYRTFFNVFKRIIGKSPTEYKRQLSQ